MKKNLSSNRRQFIKNTAKASLAFTIVPRFVMGGRGFIAPSDQITLGFIGTGKQARSLAEFFSGKAKIIAGADVDSQKLELFKTNVGKINEKNKAEWGAHSFTGYADFREMLHRKDIDAIVVATPDHWHAVASIMSANAGKHVYCEKPLAHTIEEGRAMVSAVKKNKIIFQTGSMQRSWENFRHACELVRNGYIGDIKEVQVNVGTAAIPDYLLGQPIPENLNWDSWVGPAPFRPFNAELAPPVEKDIYPNWRFYKEYGGGILSDWGAHMFDIAQWALGMDRSAPTHYFPPDEKKYKQLTMVYQNGIVMKHLDFGRGFGVRFIGTKGKLDISRGYLDTDPANIVSAQIKPGETHLYKSNDHYKDWLEGIRHHQQPICDVETGHRTSSVCCIANIAYWLNRPLHWDPATEQFINDREANALAKASIRGSWKLQ
ncbi:MAG: Gfo/Idh/MocA family oxidoreductase [Niabella sp.]|nr:Gfo/Idh/MocA family oxidoreductase [Niabella sp.]